MSGAQRQTAGMASAAGEPSAAGEHRPLAPGVAHHAARLEDAIHRRVAVRLRRKGWQPRVKGYTCYGTTSADGSGWIRVLGRVLLGRPEPPRHLPELVRGWRSFVTLPLPALEVGVEVAGQQHAIRSDRSGYLDAVVPASLAPGWHDVRLSVDGAPLETSPVVVIGPEQQLGLVSDIDDTVMVTSLPRPMLAFWNTFVLHEHARRPVPGMATFYLELLHRHPGMPVFYLSTGAWNVAPTLARFLYRHGYPDGPLLLTDWGPTTEGWFRSGQAHKRASLARLARELPQVRWLLVGDDGQHDPQLYGEFVRHAAANVHAVAIRHLSPTEQVLASGLPVPAPAVHDGEGQGDAEVEVPWVSAPDGTGIRDTLREQGLL